MKNVLQFSSPYRPFCSYWWQHWLHPGTYLYPILYAYQRVTRGWADCDTWSLDNHLCEVISDAVDHLAASKCGYPGSLQVEDDEGAGPAKWNRILCEISAGFKAGPHVDDMPQEFITELETSTGIMAQLGMKDQKYDMVKICAYQAEQRDKFDHGMKLFHQYFFSL